MDSGSKIFIFMIIVMLCIRTVLSSSMRNESYLIYNEDVAISGSMRNWTLENGDTFKEADIKLPWNIVISKVPVKLNYTAINGDDFKSKLAKDSLESLLNSAEHIKLIPSAESRDKDGRIIGELIVINNNNEIIVKDWMQAKGLVEHNGINSK